MPPRKQPMRLEDLALRKCIDIYRRRCEDWLNALYSAHQSGEEAYSLALRHASDEYHKMKYEISTLPPTLLRVLSPGLATEVVELLSSYEHKIPLTQKNTYRRGREAFSACDIVFRSVLNRYIHRLGFVPESAELCIKPTFLNHRSEILANMFRHLTNLQIFNCPGNCTDKIIHQLRLHCPNLTHIDAANSRQVTNFSVEHLLELEKLKFLNLEGTQIDVQLYGLLLSNLPQIGNVSYVNLDDDVLPHITAEKLDTITHIKGYYRNIRALTQKFPNTTNISLYCSYTKLPGLTGFRALHVLEIVCLDNDTSALSHVLLEIGHRLSELKLAKVQHLNLHEIVTLCPSLITLSLIGCAELRPNQNKPFDSHLPHFRDLINLTISNNFGPSVALGFIRYYVSLNTINLEDINFFTAEFVKDIISLGNMTQLEVFHIRSIDQAPITMEAVQLLLQHCSLLKRIEGLAESLDGNLIANLERQMLEQNFDLVIE
jgi:hypothetical protein